MTTTLARPPVDPSPAPPRRRTARLAVGALLAATAALYLRGLSASGWANTYYAAAAQAGSQSWLAWFFGSSDAANSITVDKTPASLWVTGLSVRLFGLSSWSILVPQALMGVATVALLYATVRRTAGPAAGLLAGAVLALTPVAVLMFRFNNPDALLVLVLVGAAYATSRAVEAGRTRWLLLAATLVGFGFLTKMLQAFLVVPALALVWLVAAPVWFWRRVRDLLLAGVALVVSAGWWVLIVQLWPAGSRPYIGGSQADSVIELALGYNGLGRLNGEEIGSVGGRMAGAEPPPGVEISGGWGESGLTRLFDAENGGQASWLLPTALVVLLVLLVARWRVPRTDRIRAAALLWGGWLLVTALTFSLMAGIYHSYYTVALAPAVAALVGLGGVELWRRRAAWWARGTLAAVVALTVAWAFVLLHRTPEWLPLLAWVVVAVGAAAALALLAVHRTPRVVTAGALTAAVLSIVAGPVAYAVETVTTAQSGALPAAGPPSATGPGGRRMELPGGERPAGGLQIFDGGPIPLATGHGPMPGNLVLGGPGGNTYGIGGLLGGETPPAAVTDLVRQNASDYTWAAAAVGANVAAGVQLATGAPVMPVGGFNGTDPSPTLAEFQRLVADGEIHWFVGGMSRGGMAMGGSSEAQRIQEWVEATFPKTTVEDVTLYDLTAPA